MNKKKLNGFFIVVEIAWIVMAVFCLVAGVYYHAKIGIANAWLIYMLSVICIGMFLVRRQQRKNSQRRNNN